MGEGVHDGIDVGGSGTIENICSPPAENHAALLPYIC